MSMENSGRGKKIMFVGEFCLIGKLLHFLIQLYPKGNNESMFYLHPVISLPPYSTTMRHTRFTHKSFNT